MARLSRNVVSSLVAMAAVAVFGWLLLGSEEPKAKPRAPAAGAPADPVARVEPPAVSTGATPTPPAAKPAIAIPQPTAAASSPSTKPRSALQAAFEREVPDATAAQAEERIRAIFKDQPHFDVVFRHVLCTRSVCRL